jgi:hypothetical protein
LKILCFIPNSSDGTSLYRGFGALNELHKNDLTIQITYVDMMAFRMMDAKGFDIAYFQRPDDIKFVIFMEALKKINIRIVVDYDDYLLDVPSGNRYHALQARMDIPYENNVIACLKLADQVIVSTELLQKKFSVYNQNITVIRNGFDDYCFKLCKELSPNRIVLWRGGATHQPDFDFYGDEVYQLIKNNEDFTFIFWTELFNRPENSAYASISRLLDDLPNVIIKEAVSPLDYLQGLQKIRPSLIMSVNRENDFNLCKSNIAKLEGFYCGALCLHNDWDEWQWPVFKPQSEYLLDRGMLFLDLIRQKSQLVKDIYQEELEHVKQNYLLSELNKKRIEVFKKAVKR